MRFDWKFLSFLSLILLFVKNMGIQKNQLCSKNAIILQSQIFYLGQLKKFIFNFFFNSNFFLCVQFEIKY